MTIKIEASQRLKAALNFPPIGPEGLNGRYTETFMGSKGTAEKFVKYLESMKAKGIETGKRGQDCYVSWDGPFVDYKDWQRKGFPITKG
jgi:hypothetical protein